MQLQLKIGDNEIRGWQTAGISRSLEEASGSFALQLTGADVLPDWLVYHAACDLRVGPDTILKGRIDIVDGEIGPAGLALDVTGRSLTREIVDCAALGAMRLNGLRVDQIAEQLCAPYGVAVHVPEGVDVGDALPRFTLDQGETAYEAITRAAEHAALLVTDDALGRLVLTRAGEGAFTQALTALRPDDPGSPVLRRSARFDGSQVFSEYICRGQSAGSDKANGDAVAGISAIELDRAFAGPRRVKILQSNVGTTAAKARDRARWEATTRLARSATAVYTLRGWYQGASDVLWAPGFVIPVDDPRLRLASTFLTVQVDLDLDPDAGATSTLQLAPLAGYLKAPGQPVKR